MKHIAILTDYKGVFESKYIAKPYRSGMDRKLLRKSFNEKGFDISFISFCEIDFRNPDLNKEIFLYTSSEDYDYLYKSYIEDIIYGLELAGARVVPDYKFLKANNNKVFMEILRDSLDINEIKEIRSSHFGVIEDIHYNKVHLESNTVTKSAFGSKSRGVILNRNESEIFKNARKISSSPHIFTDSWDFIRWIRHKGYIRESRHRKKFIIQNYIQGLQNDWKVLIYGPKYYVLRRENRKNDFRASGSGKLSYQEQLPAGLLDFAKGIFSRMNVPNLSLDIGFDGKTYFLFEFQAVYFGTYTIDFSPFYFIKEIPGWKTVKEPSVLEMEYARSIAAYLNNLEPGK